jgi:anti-anti-sigma factor
LEITQKLCEGRLELQLKGRFDANWTAHVGDAIESAIRAGQHRVDLDLDQVSYLSSAGLGLLVRYSRQLQHARGELRVVRTTDAVLSVLQLSGVAERLVAAPQLLPDHLPAAGTGESACPDAITDSRAAAAEAPRLANEPAGTQRWHRTGVTFEAHEQQPGRTLDFRLHGRPEKFAGGQLSPSDSARVRFNADVFGIGCGAFGGGSDDARGRFGEFLAVAGAAVAQPTDGSAVPDFQTVEGRFVPEVNLLYGLTGSGGFARLLRFEAGQSEHGVIALAELVEAALENLQTPAAGFVVLAESARVVGATLRRSPALAAGQSPWNFPGVRDWLSFTTERTNERYSVLIVGFADRQGFRPLPPPPPSPSAHGVRGEVGRGERATPHSDGAAFVRRIGSGTTAQGHFHAALFPYHPLSKGDLDLKESVTSLLAAESAQAVMHLLADEREFEGIGQTELLRGACWVGPLKTPGRAPANRAITP